MPPKKINLPKLHDEIARETPADGSSVPQVLIEEESYLDIQVEKEIRLEELQTIKEANKTLAQNNVERKKYANCIFILTCCWAGIIFIVIFFVGFSLIKIANSVLITLISSTTINFFGFFLLVVKYLFNTGASADLNNLKSKNLPKKKRTKKLQTEE